MTEPTPPASPPGPPDGRISLKWLADTYGQEQVSALMTAENAAGKRAGSREAVQSVLDRLGYGKVEDLEAAIKAQRDKEAAELSDADRKLREAQEREARVAAREAEAVRREAAARRRAVLLELACPPADLADADALLTARGVTNDADDAAVKAAAEKLKAERPVLFGAAAPPTAPAGTGPSPGGPPRTQGKGAPDWMAQAKQEMIRRGLIREPS